jgi:hypothetical protein
VDKAVSETVIVVADATCARSGEFFPKGWDEFLRDEDLDLVIAGRKQLILRVLDRSF